MEISLEDMPRAGYSYTECVNSSGGGMRAGQRQFGFPGQLCKRGAVSMHRDAPCEIACKVRFPEYAAGVYARQIHSAFYRKPFFIERDLGVPLHAPGITFDRKFVCALPPGSGFSPAKMRRTSRIARESDAAQVFERRDGNDALDRMYILPVYSPFPYRQIVIQRVR